MSLATVLATTSAATAQPRNRDQWLAHVRALLTKEVHSIRYVRRADMRVMLTFAPSGGLTLILIRKGSGIKAVDEAVMAAVGRISAPPLTADMPFKPVTLVLPVRFN